MGLPRSKFRLKQSACGAERPRGGDWDFDSSAVDYSTAFITHGQRRVAWFPAPDCALSAPEVVEESLLTAEGAEIAEFISRRSLRTLR